MMFSSTWSARLHDVGLVLKVDPDCVLRFPGSVEVNRSDVTFALKLPVVSQGDDPAVA